MAGSPQEASRCVQGKVRAGGRRGRPDIGTPSRYCGRASCTQWQRAPAQVGLETCVVRRHQRDDGLSQTKPEVGFDPKMTAHGS